MNSGKTAIVIIAILALLASYISPVIRTLVSSLEYLSISEKDISQEILVEPKNYFEKLSPKDLINLGEFLQYKILPIISSLDSITIKPSVNSVESFRREILEYENKIMTINESCNKMILIELNENNKILLKGIRHEINILIDSIAMCKNVSTIAASNTKLAIIRDEKQKKSNIFYNFMLNVLRQAEKNSESIGLYHYLSNKLNEKSDNLIDNKPYFSMPISFAQAKEKEIFDFLENNPDNFNALLALVYLYLEMKNYYDAEVVFINFVKPLSKESESNLEEYLITSKLIENYSRDKINADINGSKITLKDNLDAVIEEDYTIHESPKGKKIIIHLPYPQNNIFVQEIKGQGGIEIKISEIRDSWKNSSILLLEGTDTLREIHLKYKTSNFVKYSEEFGKYYFRYGGVISSRRYICEANISALFKVTNLEQSYDTYKSKDDYNYFKWIEPQIPYKISALEFVGSKNGIGGELIDSRDLQNRLFFHTIVLFVFLLILFLSETFLKESYFYKPLLILASIFSSVLLLNDLQFAKIISTILIQFPPIISRVASAVLWGVILILFQSRKADNQVVAQNYFDSVSLVFKLAMFAIVVKTYIENIDFTDRLAYIVPIIVGLVLLNDLFSEISIRLQINKVTLITVSVVMYLILLFAFKQISLFKLDKKTLDYTGVTLGSFLILLLLIMFIANNRKIVNERKKSVMSAFYEEVALRFQPIAPDATKGIFLVLIILTVFFNSSVIPILIAMLGAAFEGLIKKMINKNSIKAESLNK